MLATSRVSLGITGEQRVPVSPLALTADADDTGAIRLFVDRARSIDPLFAPDASVTPIVQEICSKLDGLPLAIELAATRVAHLSPADILVRLSQPMAFLASFQRDGPERHTSMHRAIAWSHDLLSADAQWLYRRLAVFVGGIPLCAIEGLLASRTDLQEDAATLSILSELVDHSFLRQTTGSQGPSRFEMLETIREFGLEQLAVHGEEEPARDLHAAWALRHSSQAIYGLARSMNRERLDRLEVDLPNLRLATSWLADADRIEEVAQLNLDVCLFRAMRGYAAETAAIFDLVLEHPRAQVPGLVRARALHGRASVLHLREDRPLARRMAEEAIELFQQFGDTGQLIWTYMLLGLASRADNDIDQSIAAYTAALELSRELGVPSYVGAALTNLGQIAMLQGDIERAIDLQNEALDVSTAAGDPWIEGFGHLHLAQIAIEQGQDERADGQLRRSRELFEELGDKLDLPKIELAQSRLAARRDDLPAAKESLERALEGARAIGETDFAGQIMLELARTASSLGDHHDAVQHTLGALEIFRAIDQPFRVGECLVVLAFERFERNDLQQAASFLALAEVIMEGARLVRPVGFSRDDPEKLKRAIVSTVGSAEYEALRARARAMARDTALAEVVTAADLLRRETVSMRHAAVLKETGLSERELEVLRWLAEGLTNQEVADALFVSRRTIASHIDHILAKLGARSRTAAVAFAIRNGLA